jgi:hypothetical protein
VLKLIVGAHHVVEVHVLDIKFFKVHHVVANVDHVVTCVHHVANFHRVHLLSQVPPLLFIMLLLTIGVHQVVLPLYG